jgi:DNA-binding NarL/FixJ family response regulator
VTNEEWESARETIYSYGFSPQVVLEAEEHIKSLSPKRQRILLLAMGGLNQPEIGKRLGIPQQTISDNIFKIIGIHAPTRRMDIMRGYA